MNKAWEISALEMMFLKTHAHNKFVHMLNASVKYLIISNRFLKRRVCNSETAVEYLY